MANRSPGVTPPSCDTAFVRSVSIGVMDEEEHMRRILDSYQELLDDDEVAEEPSYELAASQKSPMDPKTETMGSSHLPMSISSISVSQLPQRSVRSVAMLARTVPARLLSPELLAELGRNQDLCITFDVEIHPGFEVVGDSLSDALDKNLVVPTVLPITSISPAQVTACQPRRKKTATIVPRLKGFFRAGSGQKGRGDTVVGSRRCLSENDHSTKQIEPTASGHCVEKLVGDAAHAEPEKLLHSTLSMIPNTTGPQESRPDGEYLRRTDTQPD